MRLKSEIWVKAYLRRCNVNGAMAVVARHGDDDAGAIFIKVIARNDVISVYGPAPAGSDGIDIDRFFAPVIGSPFTSEREADAFLDQQSRFDSDIWIIDVEDGQGRHLLDDAMQDDSG